MRSVRPWCGSCRCLLRLPGSALTVRPRSKCVRCLPHLMSKCGSSVIALPAYGALGGLPIGQCCTFRVCCRLAKVGRILVGRAVKGEAPKGRDRNQAPEGAEHVLRGRCRWIGYLREVVLITRLCGLVPR